jgi:hypothetical protein
MGSIFRISSIISHKSAVATYSVCVLKFPSEMMMKNGQRIFTSCVTANITASEFCAEKRIQKEKKNVD